VAASQHCCFEHFHNNTVQLRSNDIGLILIGIMGLKLTDMNLFWACIAVGAAVGCHGGVSISQRARV